MKWREEYATGVERLDEQHRMLFRTTADFRAALDEGRGERTYGVLLGYLDGYCRAHFGQEERCMEEYRCPVATQNRRAHAEFIGFLQDVRRQYEAEGFRAADARRLVDMLDGWLAGHIGGVDAHLKDHVPR